MVSFKSIIKVFNAPLNKKRHLRTLLILVWWKINQIVFKLPALIEIAPERYCICYPGSSFGSLIVYTKRPEYLEMKLTELLLQHDSSFIDVGAGIGDFSLIASSKIRNGRILALEPAQEPLGTLIKNIALNSLNNTVSIISEVASDKIGSINFEETSVSEISHIGNGPKSIQKKTTTVDELIRKFKLSYVDLIKIDVEGAESLVVGGLKKSFKNGVVGCLIIELNANAEKFGGSKTKTINLLINNGFHVFLIGETSLLNLKPSDFSEKRTVNILAVHKSFARKSVINQFLS